MAHYLFHWRGDLFCGNRAYSIPLWGERNTMNSYYVYVQNKDGTPLMCTKRYGWVRRALKQGLAKAVQTIPFTIRLNYEVKDPVVQKVYLSPDMGRTNIGISAVREDGKCLFRAKCESNNKDVKDNMFHRSLHRKSSRSGDRKARKRLAKKYHTTLKQVLKRKLPGYGTGTVTVKDIINTEAKFNNRRREKGWLTPTARHLLLTHQGLVKAVLRILPIAGVSLEYNKFDFVRMENPHVKPWEYGHGPLEGCNGSMIKALRVVQGGKCLVCGKPEVSRKHHIVPIAKGGSDTLGNTAGLCEKCHEKTHTVIGFTERIEKKKKGFNKKYGALSTINQIMSRFTQWCTDQFPETYAIHGYDTKKYRDQHGLVKDHDIDSYCMSAMILGIEKPDNDMPPCYFIKQYRHHDRARVKAQVYRTYYYEGKKVAKNRAPAFTAELGRDDKLKVKRQREDALTDWYQKMAAKHGEKEATRMRSQLKVRKSFRRYNNLDRAMPGSILYYKGRRYVLQNQITGGEYYHVYGEPDSFRLPASECTVYPNRGLVFVN